MGNEKDLDLREYNIGINEYRELKYFCMQYRDKKRVLKQKNTRISDGMREKYRGDVEMIERCAEEAAGNLAALLLKNVVDGVKYEYLNIPCSRWSFYEMRKRYFWILRNMTTEWPR